ncbi:MAG: CsiV family protein [Candidatus Thiodiazotropha sp.]
MIRFRHKLTTLLIGTLLLQPLVLQAADENRDNAPVWYQFEVLVFERIAPGAGSTESWSNDPGRPPSSGAAWFTKGQHLKGNKPIAFRALPAEERSLNDAWGQMRRSRDYRPLYHVAWRQPVMSPEKAKQVFFSLLPADGAKASDVNLPKLEGSLKFSVKRYLHLNADIALHKLASGSDPQAAGDNFGFAPRYRHYRLQESRRMRSGKLYYIDHPVLGILATAERYQPPQPEPIETPIPVPTIIPPTQSQQLQPKPANQ